MYFNAFSRTLIITLIIVGAASSQAVGLGSASAYNLFVLNNANLSNSDTQGRVAARSATFSGYDIGLNDPGGDVLVVGNNLNYNNGTIRGNARVGGLASLVNVAFTNGGSLIPGSTIDFNAVTTEMTGLSTTLASVNTHVGTSNTPFSTLILTGGFADYNTFNITAAQLTGIFGVDIQVPAGSTALINVSGASVNFPNIGYMLNGSQDNNAFRKVLWNMSSASTLGITSLRGSVLAPLATANTAFGAIEGQFVVNNFTGSVQVNHYPFNGNLPVPEPATFIALGAGVAVLLRQRRK